MGRVLNRVSLRGGVYRGLLTGGAGDPALAASCGETDLPVTVVALEGGDWQVEVDLSGLGLSEGCQTVVVREGDAVLDALGIVAGLDARPEGDLRAEVDLLRAEVEMLKGAFRRHVREG